jgi:hypothetical protein
MLTLIVFRGNFLQNKMAEKKMHLALGKVAMTERIFIIGGVE